LAEQSAIPIVHVTHFNQLFWDCGRAPTTVVEHGIVDPGYRYKGDHARAGVVVNEPIRRWRVTGTDLLATFSRTSPLDVFGMGVRELPKRLGADDGRVVTFEDLPQHRMHEELARRRVYLHPFRWTSLGLALVEAMHLGMPIVSLATTEVVDAVPPDAGVVSNRPEALTDALRDFLADPDRARETGAAARAAATRRYSLHRFLAARDRIFEEVTR
jgi:glycosyltransferase involved in cell wall biosynthesis